VDLGFHGLPQLIGRMAAYRIHEFLIDMGTLETYQKAQQAWPGFSLWQPTGIGERLSQDKSRSTEPED